MCVAFFAKVYLNALLLLETEWWLRDCGVLGPRSFRYFLLACIDKTAFLSSASCCFVVLASKQALAATPLHFVYTVSINILSLCMSHLSDVSPSWLLLTLLAE